VHRNARNSPFPPLPYLRGCRSTREQCTKLPIPAAPLRAQLPFDPRARPRPGLAERCDPTRGVGRPKRSGRPQAAQVHWSFCPTARPSSQTGRRRAGWSGAPCRLMGYRRDADLRAWHGRSRPAHARSTIQWPAVRVLARGGGGDPGRDALRSPCLTQRRERGGRVDGLAHQLAQRALPRATGDRLGEHVFGRLGGRSDGTRNVRESIPSAPGVWLCSAEIRPRALQPILQGATKAHPILQGARKAQPILQGRRTLTRSRPPTPPRG
jgi:hypothetical protein